MGRWGHILLIGGISSMDSNLLNGLVRIGIVTAINKTNYTARVKFQDVDVTSGWLPVLQYPGLSVAITPASDHTHSVSVSHWMPSVNDNVLTLYIPVLNGDGFILGVIV